MGDEQKVARTRRERVRFGSCACATQRERERVTMPTGGGMSSTCTNGQRGGGPGGPSRGAKPAPGGGGARGRRAGPTKQKQVYHQSYDGVQVSPLMVLVLSLGLIGVVTFLHIVGKVIG